MDKIKPNNKFKAVFNPYTLELAVRYGTYDFIHQFSEHDEWCYINFNGNDEHPNYLHVHCDYDEELQLIFYPRVDDPTSEEKSSSLNEHLTKSWCSSLKRNSYDIKIANGKHEFTKLFTNHLK